MEKPIKKEEQKIFQFSLIIPVILPEGYNKDYLDNLYMEGLIPFSLDSSKKSISRAESQLKDISEFKIKGILFTVKYLEHYEC